jgi:hypothetical protein
MVDEEMVGLWMRSRGNGEGMGWEISENWKIEYRT